MVKKSVWCTRRTHMLAFKVRMTLTALTELCEQFKLRPNQITEWKR